MKKLTFTILLLWIIKISAITGQTITSLAKDLPPYFSVLTDWGVRPSWDETSENIYFLNKQIGDVFKINLKTREITAVTAHFYHGGIYRVVCLPNGDLLLAINNKPFNPQVPEEHRHSGLELCILKKDSPSKPFYLGQVCDEGPAVSKTNMKIAWTLKGQREIKAADIIYKEGIPELINVQTLISYNDSGQYVRLETQDFRPPHDEELIYTHYFGDERDPFSHSQVYGIKLATKKIIRYTNLPDSYNEAEGIFPDGNYIMIESDRHQPLSARCDYRIDIYKLKLDGSGSVERLVDFSTRYPDQLRSNNPVVNNTGTLIAHQFGYRKGSGDGKGIFLLDLEAYEKYKKGIIAPSAAIRSGIFYQYSIWGAFVNKIFDGDLTVNMLKMKGNIGLGSFDFLDGEMVMLNGIVYRIREDGEVSIADGFDQIVYANATFSNPNTSLRSDITALNIEKLKEALNNKIESPNHFYAFTIHGNFKSIKLGGLNKQQKPFEKGLDVLIPGRPVFTPENISGTLVGFYCPKYIGNINVAGYHFHFISDDRKYGGHVMDFQTKENLHTELTRMVQYQFDLPDVPEFKDLKFEKDFQYNPK